MISSRIILDGGKNLILQVQGDLQDQKNPWEMILDLDAGPRHPTEQVRIDGASWLIQEKGSIFLWWDKNILIFPMESRNKADFYFPLQCPHKVWTRRIYMSWENCPTLKYFMFQLNMDKP